MTTRTRTLLCTIAVLLWLGPSLAAQPLAVVEPESVGLSSDRLEHLTRVVDRNVEDRLLAGSVTLVAREGEVAYLKAAGMRDREAEIPMTTDTIFRVASMTKPITSVAVMMLYEEGRFRLSDPVSTYIPAFEDVRVLADSATAEPVSAERPITIRHLLTHTSGLAYQWNPKLGERYADRGITHGLVGDENTLAEDIPKLARVPLLHHPGEAWTYGLSIDVLGYLVEVVSGMPLDEFFRTRIFEPLGMDDTQFHVSKAQESRLAAAYTVGSDGGLQRIRDERLQGSGATVYSAVYPAQESHRYLSGGAGLTSTVPDYYRFAQMLLNGGRLDGVQLLSPETVELMTTDHVGDLRDAAGFGLGFGVTRSLAERGELDSVGTFGWGSFWYGTFFVDPAEDLIGISVAQKHPGGNATLNAKFRILAHQAIVE
jgi:CubicO group peptidase (beta-lactamase class C family)